MRFLKWYALLLKRALKRIDTYLAALAMVALVLVISSIHLPSVENVRVLVYAATEDDRAAIMQAVQENDHVFQFELAASEEAIKEAVISGEVECGFCLTPDFREVLARKEQRRIVNFYCSTLSTKSEVALESFYASLLTIASKEWLDASLADIYVDGAEKKAEISQALVDRQIELRESAALFYIVEETIAADGTVIEHAESGDGKLAGVDLSAAAERIEDRTQPIRGTVAIFVFLMIFLAIGRNLKTEQSGFAMYLSFGEKQLYRLAVALSAATVPTICGFIVLQVTGQVPGTFGVVPGTLGEVFRWLLFLAYSIAWCILFALLLKKENRYMASLIAILLAIVAICPVYVYTATYVPVARYLQWILPVSVLL